MRCCGPPLRSLAAGPQANRGVHCAAREEQPACRCIRGAGHRKEGSEVAREAVRLPCYDSRVPPGADMIRQRVRVRAGQQVQERQPPVKQQGHRKTGKEGSANAREGSCVPVSLSPPDPPAVAHPSLHHPHLQPPASTALRTCLSAICFLASFSIAVGSATACSPSTRYRLAILTLGLGGSSRPCL